MIKMPFQKKYTEPMIRVNYSIPERIKKLVEERAKTSGESESREFQKIVEAGVKSLK
jgi:hypothetical protein